MNSMIEPLTLNTSSLIIADSNQQSTFCFDVDHIDYQHINKANSGGNREFVFDISALADLEPELAQQLIEFVQQTMVALARNSVSYQFDSADFHHQLLQILQSSRWYETRYFKSYFEQIILSYCSMLEMLLLNLQAPFEAMDAQSNIMINNTVH
jgi:hypothetical protein